MRTIFSAEFLRSHKIREEKGSAVNAEPDRDAVVCPIFLWLLSRYEADQDPMSVSLANEIAGKQKRES